MCAYHKICGNILLYLDAPRSCTKKCTYSHSISEHLGNKNDYFILYEQNNMNLEYNDFLIWLDLRNANRKEIIGCSKSELHKLENRSQFNSVVKAQLCFFNQLLNIETNIHLQLEKCQKSIEIETEIVDEICSLHSRLCLLEKSYKDELSARRKILENIHDLNESSKKLSGKFRKNFDNHLSNISQTEKNLQWLKNAIDNYTNGKIISESGCGSGGNANVYLKIIQCNNSLNDKIKVAEKKTLSSEITLIQQEHSNRLLIKNRYCEGIFTLIGLFGNRMVMKYYNCTLRELTSKLPDFENRQKMMPIILSKLIKGLEKIHELQYYHADIKPENILINYEEDHLSEICLGDLGSMVKFNKYSRTTIGYCAPEYENHIFGSCGDIYALGKCMIEFLDNKFYHHIIGPENVSISYIHHDLLCGMINNNHVERFTLHQITNILSIN